MKGELTNDQISQVCMYMRVVEYMKKNEKILSENEEMKKNYEKLCLTVAEIMESITDEQRDEVLEVHKKQLKQIAKQEAKKQSNKQPKTKKK